MRTTRLTTNTLKIGALTAIFALVLPLAATAPAQAIPPFNGCKVTPSAPVYGGKDLHGRDRVKYQFTVSCDPGRRVKVQRQFWEKDWDGPIFTDGDDEAYPWPADVGFVFPPIVGSRIYTEYGLLPNTHEGDNAEEMYLQTRFRVYSGGVASEWSPWREGAYTSIHH